MIRFYLILIFFLISLLSFLKAPAYYLWLLAIGVTEFPLVFAGITALLTVSGIWVQKYQLAGTILGLVTLAIFLSPIIRAYRIAKDIQQNMATALSTQPNNETPFSVLKLFSSTKDAEQEIWVHQFCCHFTWIPTFVCFPSDKVTIASSVTQSPSACLALALLTVASPTYLIINSR